MVQCVYMYLYIGEQTQSTERAARESMLGRSERGLLLAASLADRGSRLGCRLARLCRVTVSLTSYSHVTLCVSRVHPGAQSGGPRRDV